MDEAKIEVERIKEEWLVGNAVVAFVGALLMAQAWEPSDVKNEIPIFDVSVPTFPEAVVLGTVAFLATVSFVLALASVIPRIRSWAIYQASPLSYLLEILMWVAFLMSLLSALAELPPEQWWAQALWLGGAALLFFLWGRMVLRPLIPPAKWSGRSLFQLLRWTWRRTIVSKRSLVPPQEGAGCEPGSGNLC